MLVGSVVVVRLINLDALFVLYDVAVNFLAVEL